MRSWRGRIRERTTVGGGVGGGGDPPEQGFHKAWLGLPVRVGNSEVTDPRVSREAHSYKVSLLP